MAEKIETITTRVSDDSSQNCTGGDYDEWFTVWKTRLGYIAFHFSSADCTMCELRGDYTETIAVEVGELGVVQMSMFLHQGLCTTLGRHVIHCTLDEFNKFWTFAETKEELFKKEDGDGPDAIVLESNPESSGN